MWKEQGLLSSTFQGLADFVCPRVQAKWLGAPVAPPLKCVGGTRVTSGPPRVSEALKGASVSSWLYVSVSLLGLV